MANSTESSACGVIGYSIAGLLAFPNLASYSAPKYNKTMISAATEKLNSTPLHSFCSCIHLSLGAIISKRVIILTTLSSSLLLSYHRLSFV